MTIIRTAPLAQFYDDLTVKEDKARPTGIKAYAFSLRQNVRAFWSGKRDFDQFLETLNDAVRFHLELAWREGAAECGVRPEERTPEEADRLQAYIINQLSYTIGLAEFVEAHTQAQGALLGTSIKRLDPWVNRWNEVKAIAQLSSCENEKLVWRLGKTLEHCKTCSKLNGRVMRRSRWKELDVWPQDTRPGKLDCKGFRCDCHLDKTNQRVTPGRLPKLQKG